MKKRSDMSIGRLVSWVNEEHDDRKITEEKAEEDNINLPLDDLVSIDGQTERGAKPVSRASRRSVYTRMTTRSRKAGWSKRELVESPERRTLRQDKQ